MQRQSYPVREASQFQLSFNRYFLKQNTLSATIQQSTDSPTWNSKVGIAGRYRLQVQFPIEIDETSCAVRQTGAAAFFLNEVTSVISLQNGQHEIRYGRDIKFDEAQWHQLREAHGDIGIFGIPKPIQPVPGFEEIKTSAMKAEQNGCRQRLIWHLSCHRRLCQRLAALPCGLPVASHIAPLHSLAVA